MAWFFQRNDVDSHEFEGFWCLFTILNVFLQIKSM